LGDLKKKKKLTGKEIDQVLEKIRDLYDYYMVRFIKSRRTREAFEERYREALRTRIDLERFLSLEIKTIEQMIAREEDRYQAELKRMTVSARGDDDAQAGERDDGKDFADRVIERLKEQVEKYPVAGLECSEVWEVDHLFGALQKIEAEYWPKIDRIYRKIYASRFDGPRIVLENKLLTLAEARMGGVPSVLHTLQLLVGRFPRNYREIEWEVKQSILRASFFLHNFKEELEKFRDDSYLAEKDRAVVNETLEYVDGIIEDFRLKDLKQKN